MSTQVIFYGTRQKAATLLGSVQAAIEGLSRDTRKCSSTSVPLLHRYLAELEEIERDLVALLNAAGEETNIGDDRDGTWATRSPNGDV